ncbi:hypothetical protein SADUNF_Sadunf08G0159300 [Salix dunnii]|uniref:Uncharacterized protein n=1 Tax=Salix dunnii TaxID=1413687 RepID=A0A835MT56_9ROSI|nr:hypothetical protein SADUNF_Sadunf08G0159300 [Salix dunnii]
MNEKALVSTEKDKAGQYLAPSLTITSIERPTRMNSSGMAVSMFAAACVAVLVMAAAAHEGHDHTPGMEMPPAPSPSSSTLVSPSMVIGIALAFIASLLVGRERA